MKKEKAKEKVHGRETASRDRKIERKEVETRKGRNGKRLGIERESKAETKNRLKKKLRRDGRRD